MNNSPENFSILPESPKKQKKAERYRYDLVVVKWHDAHSDSAWSSPPTDVLKPCIATTVGFVIRDNPDEDYLVADSYIVNGDYSDTISNLTQIPRGMIQSITTLKKKAKGDN